MRDLIIDCFAGGGGASVGIEMALGRQVDIAVNHDPKAILMHKTNHPDTLHLTEDIFSVDLKKYVKDRHVALMWASPDCTSHSKAKGGKPRESGLRMLPWAVYKHAKSILPDVIIMENVEEIQQWGPLAIESNRPVPELKGNCYQCFVSHMCSGKQRIDGSSSNVPEKCYEFCKDCVVTKEMYLESLGYTYDSRELVAADYGAPTTRKRWYAIFRRDGKPIIWPESSHSKNGTDGLKKWVPVSGILNFSDLGNSIFGRKKPLADNTMNRIARGLRKFVFSCQQPFIVQVNHGGDNFRGQNIEIPMPTITQKHGFGVVAPSIMQIGQTGFTKERSRGVDDCLSTIVTKNEHCLVSPLLIQYHSETTKNEVRGQGVDSPIRTIDTNNRYAMVAAYLTKFYKSGCGQSLHEPLHTITTSPGHFGQMSVLAVEYQELLKAGVTQEIAQKCTWVSEFIIEYYGSGTGQSVYSPLHTVVTKDRFALITVLGNEYVILDIFLRMLSAEELKLAQGFPKDYIIDKDYMGKKYPVSERVRRIGNSVVPVMAQKLVEANCGCLKAGERVGNMYIDDTQAQLRFA